MSVNPHSRSLLAEGLRGFSLERLTDGWPAFPSQEPCVHRTSPWVKDLGHLCEEPAGVETNSFPFPTGKPGPSPLRKEPHQPA